MGYFITLEGTDGSGKTTQIQLLKEFFRKSKHEILFTREPGGTPLAEKIRDIIIDKDNKMNDYTEAFLYAAARCEHVNEVIKPFLAKGGIVISDRFLDSSLAYQGVARGMGIDNIMTINSFATNGLNPDLTILFDLAPEESIKRRITETVPDRIELEGSSFQEKVYKGYKKISEDDPERFLVIDATLEQLEIHKTIVNTILQKI